MGKYTHECKMCGKQFDDYFKTANFCSRDCYYQYRRENGKLKEITCPICGKQFRQTYSKQMFCSVECRAKSTENKVECTCDSCGKAFFRIKSEVDKNKHHYCSIDCRNKAMWWSEDDTNILRENFGKLSYKDMVGIFSVPKTVDEISRRAIYIGLTSTQEWPLEEVNLLIENYSTKPMCDVMSLFPNRSQPSILGKAKSLGLKSYFYLSRIYTEEDEEYLKNNYLNKTNEELAEVLNRSVSAIAQRLSVLKLYRPNDRAGYNNLSEYIRGRLIPWFKQTKLDCNFTCAVTGVRTNIITHHIRGFNLILDEAINAIDFPIYDSVSNYTNEQLDEIFNTFFNLQESYKSYVCITESVHKHFHSIYGYGNNTEEQWAEFINTYYKKLN